MSMFLEARAEDRIIYSLYFKNREEESPDAEDIVDLEKCFEEACATYVAEHRTDELVNGIRPWLADK